MLRLALGDTLAQHDPAAEARRRFFGAAFWIVLAGFLVYALCQSVWSTWKPPSLINILFIVLFNFAWRLSWNRHAKGFQPPLNALSATLTATGRCGHCGYPITNLSPAEDGRVECPECSMAWHTDRMVASQSPFDQERLSLRLKLLRSTKFSGAGLATDDRGVLLAKPVVWPPPRFSKDLPPRFHDHLVGRFKRRQALLRQRPLFALAIVWFFAILSIPIWDDKQQPAWPIITVIFTLIAVVLAFAITRVSLARQHVRIEYLAACCCPECHSLLERSIPQFDGCVPCPSCNHAWRADALGTPPPDHALTNVPCHSCGYNAVNLPICPECGTVTPKAS